MSRPVYYLGNQNLKNIGQPIEFTKDNVEEYIRCSSDPIYFIKNYVKIITIDHGQVPFKLYPYQEDFITKLNENRFVLGMQPRQTGKCISLNSNIKIRQKSTGKIIDITIGEFYVWQQFKEYGTINDLCRMQEIIREKCKQFLTQ